MLVLTGYSNAFSVLSLQPPIVGLNTFQQQWKLRTRVAFAYFYISLKINSIS